MASEKNFENRIKDFLTNQGCWFVKYWGGGEFTKAGVPDILCCCQGQFLGIEVKAPNGKPTDLQIINLRNIDKAGGLGILLYPKDFELFKELIRSINQVSIEAQIDIYEELKERWVVKLASITQQG